MDERGIARLVEALDAYKEAKARGEASTFDEELLAGLTPQERAELEEAREAIDLLYANLTPAQSQRSRCLEDTVEERIVDNRQKQLGRFLLREELGRGGFGVVIRAFDPLVRRDIALKIPVADFFSNPRVRLRCMREAEAAGRLAHPNIVRVLEVGEVGETVYIALEYVAGPSLAAWLRRSKARMPIAQAAQLVAALAEAVEHAHRHGVLHRDLKPANVLLDVRPFDETDRLIPKLTDFSLAKMTDECRKDTRTGAILGTPNYMAPEQAEGRSALIGPATDVYALGAVLYELLVGAPPFDGDSDAAVVHQISHDDPVPPRARRREIPRDLEAVCLKCLEKKPNDRYGSAQELADDLQRWLAGESVRARPLPKTLRFWRSIRRRRGLSVSVALALFVGVAASAGFAYHRRSIEKVHEQIHTIAVDRAQSAQLLEQHQYAADMEAADEEIKLLRHQDAVRRLQRYVPSPREPDRRDFAWHYLWRLAHSLKRIDTGHQEDVY